MYPGDLRGEDRCAGAASDVNELCEGCVSSSSVRNGSSWALDLLTFYNSWLAIVTPWGADKTRDSRRYLSKQV